MGEGLCSGRPNQRWRGRVYRAVARVCLCSVFHSLTNQASAATQSTRGPAHRLLPLVREAINHLPEFLWGAVDTVFSLESPRPRTDYSSVQSTPTTPFFKITIPLLHDLQICVDRSLLLLLFFFFGKETPNRMELNSLLILLEAAEYLERRDRGISNWTDKTAAFKMPELDFRMEQ